MNFITYDGRLWSNAQAHGHVADGFFFNFRPNPSKKAETRSFRMTIVFTEKFFFSKLFRNNFKGIECAQCACVYCIRQHSSAAVRAKK